MKSRNSKTRKSSFGSTKRQQERQERQREAEELKASDSNLYTKAIKGGWDIPLDVKALMLASVKKTLESCDSTSRQKMAANRVLLSMNAQNLDLDKVQPPQVLVQAKIDINSPSEAKKVAKELLKNAEYLDYQRAKLRNTEPSEQDNNSSDVRDECESVEDTIEGDLGPSEPFTGN
ncbi:MAG: hypothetical protein HN975_02110 [Anaerolineae bacterium]|jgi:hypothetical protein|nr:hypothetical protein [Anaerolineae bacterium]